MFDIVRGFLNSRPEEKLAGIISFGGLLITALWILKLIKNKLFDKQPKRAHPHVNNSFESDFSDDLDSYESDGGSGNDNGSIED